MKQPPTYRELQERLTQVEETGKYIPETEVLEFSDTGDQGNQGGEGEEGYSHEKAFKLTGVLNTNGNGLWSDVAKSVTIVSGLIDVWIEQGQIDYGELRVFFDTKTWNVDDYDGDGLIYTDPKFLIELKQLLLKHGINPQGLSYSEQGMQGDDYVSFDADNPMLQQILAMDESVQEDELAEDPLIQEENSSEIIEELEDARDQLIDLVELIHQIGRGLDPQTQHLLDRGVLAHIKTSISNDHEYLGGNMHTLQGIIDELRGSGQNDESDPDYAGSDLEHFDTTPYQR